SAVLEQVEKVYESFDDSSTPRWLRAVLEKVRGSKGGKLPAWVSVERLPSLMIGEKRLNDAQVETVLTALQTSKVESNMVEIQKESVELEGRRLPPETVTLNLRAVYDGPALCQLLGVTESDLAAGRASRQLWMWNSDLGIICKGTSVVQWLTRIAP